MGESLDINTYIHIDAYTTQVSMTHDMLHVLVRLILHCVPEILKSSAYISL